MKSDSEILFLTSAREETHLKVLYSCTSELELVISAVLKSQISVQKLKYNHCV